MSCMPEGSGWSAGWLSGIVAALCSAGPDSAANRTVSGTAVGGPPRALPRGGADDRERHQRAPSLRGVCEEDQPDAGGGQQPERRCQAGQTGEAARGQPEAEGTATTKLSRGALAYSVMAPTT
jgi:hypothetical protein